MLNKKKKENHVLLLNSYKVGTHIISVLSALYYVLSNCEIYCVYFNKTTNI